MNYYTADNIPLLKELMKEGSCQHYDCRNHCLFYDICSVESGWDNVLKRAKKYLKLHTIKEILK